MALLFQHHQQVEADSMMVSSYPIPVLASVADRLQLMNWEAFPNTLSH